MKKPLMILLGCIALSCSPPEKETPSLVGAYNQLSASLKGSDIDTTWVGQQLKIYTPDFMMYADLSRDSIGSFGFATYTAEPGIIKENVSYSASDTATDATLQPYTLEIEKTDVGFKQVIQEIGDSIKYQLTEVYERVGNEQVSPLDGAWQLSSLTVIENKDTTKLDFTIAYKVYQAGNFIFGHTYRDSTNVNHTGMGFGTFEYNDSKVKESIRVSTYKEIVGKTVDVNIALNGADEFTQTITFESGQTNIETYKRVKK
jgi:hypothetical protein